MIPVTTTHFEFAHGKKPRGRGCWFFFFDGNTDVTNPTHCFQSAGNTPYTEALRDARAMARIGGHYSIEVGS
jgi:hypothetical protein